MVILDSKAQASSVFQLLISAVVALAVLMILFSVLGLIRFDIGNEPAKATADQLKEAWNQTSTLKTTQNVTFSPSQDSINPRALADTSRVGISSNQICLSLGDFKDLDSSNFTMEGKAIKYTGSSNKVARVSVFCYTGKELEIALEEAGLENMVDWLSDCSDIGYSESDEMFCLIALRSGTR